MNVLPPMPPINFNPSMLLTRDNMPIHSIINDTRTASMFGLSTFSKFGQKQVCSEFKSALISSTSPKMALFWCAELVCSGAIINVCECIIQVLSKNVCTLNPKLAILVSDRIQKFSSYTGKDWKEGMHNAGGVNEDGYDMFVAPVKSSMALIENKIKPSTKTVTDRQKYIDMRNTKWIRELFAELTYMIWQSRKAVGQDIVSISSVDEFTRGQMVERIRAPIDNYVNPVWKKDDPIVMKLAANEFAYQIEVASKTPAGLCACNTIEAVYWIEWTIEFERISRANKNPIICAPRSQYAVSEKNQTSPIWLLWDILIYNATQRGKLVETIKALSVLFCFNYSAPNSKKHRHLLYCAVRLFTEPIDINAPLFSSIPLQEQCTPEINQVHTIYTQLYKNLHPN